MTASVPSLLLDSRAAAAALSISTRTLWSLTVSGQIPCVRIGRAVRYDIADLLAFIAESKAKTPSPGSLPSGEHAGLSDPGSARTDVA